MAAKTTVYIPDELFEQVQAYEDLNVSGLLQEALRKEVELRRRAVDKDELVIEMMRKIESEGQSPAKRFPALFALGRRDAQMLSLEALESLDCWAQEQEGESDLDLEEISTKMIELGEFIDRSYLRDFEMTSAPRVTAYVAGILNVYRAAKYA